MLALISCEMKKQMVNTSSTRAEESKGDGKKVVSMDYYNLSVGRNRHPAGQIRCRFDGWIFGAPPGEWVYPVPGPLVRPVGSKAELLLCLQQKAPPRSRAKAGSFSSQIINLLSSIHVQCAPEFNMALVQDLVIIIVVAALVVSSLAGLLLHCLVPKFDMACL